MIEKGLNPERDALEEYQDVKMDIDDEEEKTNKNKKSKKNQKIKNKKNKDKNSTFDDSGSESD